MNKFRVTKFDPQLRDATGVFVDLDWTSISDIGRVFGGKALTTEQYLHTENMYIRAAMEAVAQADPKWLSVTDIEVHPWRDAYARSIVPQLIAECKQLWKFMGQCNGVIEKKHVPTVVKAILREVAWAKILGEGGLYIHFGYDYYMYIGDAKGRLGNFVGKGLFVEDWDSPYHS